MNSKIRGKNERKTGNPEKKIKIKEGRKDENIEKNRGKCTFEPVK